MTLREVLNLMDHEVWVRVRINDGKKKNPGKDLVLWSADWHGGGEDDPGMPDGLKAVLDWDGDDLSVENYVGPNGLAQMIVVNAYHSIIPRTCVLIRLNTSPNPMNCDSNIDKLDAAVFRTLEEARNAMRSEFQDNISGSDRDHSCEENDAYIIDDEGNGKYWKITGWKDQR